MIATDTGPQTRYLVLSHNGDPYGRGFVACEQEERDSPTGVYRGDLGAQPRSFWRRYAALHGYKLVEVR